MVTTETILLEKGSGVIAVLPDLSIRQAVHRMAEANVGCLLVEHHDKYIGIFTERDLVQRVLKEDLDLDETTVQEVMTSPVEHCGLKDTAGQLVAKLCHHQFRHLLVMDGDVAVGVISLRDIAMGLRDRLLEAAGMEWAASD